MIQQCWKSSVNAVVISKLYQAGFTINSGSNRVDNLHHWMWTLKVCAETEGVSRGRISFVMRPGTALILVKFFLKTGLQQSNMFSNARRMLKISKWRCSLVEITQQLRTNLTESTIFVDFNIYHNCKSWDLSWVHCEKTGCGLANA